MQLNSLKDAHIFVSYIQKLYMADRGFAGRLLTAIYIFTVNMFLVTTTHMCLTKSLLLSK